MRYALMCLLIACGPLSTLGAGLDSPTSPKAPQADASRQVVHLDLCRGFEMWVYKAARQSHLPREIVRQAFLIAARDELGLVTRDAWLGDTMPSEGDNLPLELATKARRSSIEVTRGQGPNRQVQTKILLPRGREWSYDSLLVTAESYSRKQFVSALQDLGFTGQATPANPEARPSEKIEKGLAEMTFDAQFLAVRRLHEAIRAEGESTWMLAALTRAYANLGLLTEFHWHPAHKVFRARSLLYAQRNARQNPKKAWPRYHRAYALALAGLHGWALKELRFADESWEAEGKPPEARPAWVDLIGPYCRFEYKNLAPEKAAPRDVALAWLLRYIAIEHGETNDMIVDTALAALEELPDCYRIYDGLVEAAGVGVGHGASTAPLQRFGKAFYQRLEGVPELPRNVRSFLKQRHGNALRAFLGVPDDGPAREFRERPKLIEALTRASAPPKAETPATPGPKADQATGKTSDSAPEIPNATPRRSTTDVGEPSWAALGHLIREATFVQVFRRVEFEQESLGVSPNDFLKASEPLVAGHPYHVVLFTYSWDADEKRKAVEELRQLSPQDFDWQEWPLIWRLDEPSRKPWSNRYPHRDYLAGELKRFIDAVTWTMPADQLLSISPYSPLARTRLIEDAWDKVQDKIETWEREGADQPVVLRELAKSYLRVGRLDDAQRCAEAAVKVRADQQTTQALAAVYLKQGKEDQWLTVMESRLQLPDFGLTHGRVNNDIARHFIDKRQWQRAQPYAEGAASTYSQWGLQVLAQCHEAQQHWKEAEDLYRASSERYRTGRLEWYFFCRRTGKGDVKAAEALAREAVAREQEPSRASWSPSFMTYRILIGEKTQAIDMIEPVFAKSANPYAGLTAAMIADELQDTDLRDRLLKGVIERGHKYKKADDPVPPEVIDLARHICEDLAQGGKAEIDGTRFAGVKDSDGNWAANLRYQLAYYKQNRGKTDEARELFLRVMSSTTMNSTARTRAGAVLLSQGIGPDAYRDAVLNGPAEERDRKATEGKLPIK